MPKPSKQALQNVAGVTLAQKLTSDLIGVDASNLDALQQQTVADFSVSWSFAALRYRRQHVCRVKRHYCKRSAGKKPKRRMKPGGCAQPLVFIEYLRRKEADCYTFGDIGNNSETPSRFLRSSDFCVTEGVLVKP